MTSVNKAIILGNVGDDPKIKTMQNGNEVANFSIATTDTWKDKQTGEKKEKTEWHRIVVFSSGLVGIIKSYVKKGSKLYIEGSLQTREWTDKNTNEKKYITEIVLQGYGCSLQLLDSIGKKETHTTGYATDVNVKTPASTAGLVKQEDESVDEIIDDDIPF